MNFRRLPVIILTFCLTLIAIGNAQNALQRRAEIGMRINRSGLKFCEYFFAFVCLHNNKFVSNSIIR